MKSHVDGDVRSVEITTNQRLDVGETLEFVLDVDVSDSKPREFGVETPRVEILSPEGNVGMRAPHHAAHFPVTSSGSQLSSYLPAPAA